MELGNLSVKDLTDIIGIPESAKVLKTSIRTIYTVRNTNAISVERLMILRKHITENAETLAPRIDGLAHKRVLRAMQK